MLETAAMLSVIEKYKFRQTKGFLLIILPYGSSRYLKNVPIGHVLRVLGGWSGLSVCPIVEFCQIVCCCCCCVASDSALSSQQRAELISLRSFRLLIKLTPGLRD